MEQQTGILFNEHKKMKENLMFCVVCAVFV